MISFSRKELIFIRSGLKSVNGTWTAPALWTLLVVFQLATFYFYVIRQRTKRCPVRIESKELQCDADEERFGLAEDSGDEK